MQRPGTTEKRYACRVSNTSEHTHIPAHVLYSNVHQVIPLASPVARPRSPYCRIMVRHHKRPFWFISRVSRLFPFILQDSRPCEGKWKIGITYNHAVNHIKPPTEGLPLSPSIQHSPHPWWAARPTSSIAIAHSTIAFLIT